eukprot:Tamp_04319.p1 GENE.Tamp_04319~~Tamp_04319.p1  ORF type:complete len:487 (-),score=82.07 Tamp_04319:1703-3163(-)
MPGELPSEDRCVACVARGLLCDFAIATREAVTPPLLRAAARLRPGRCARLCVPRDFEAKFERYWKTNVSEFQHETKWTEMKAKPKKVAMESMTHLYQQCDLWQSRSKLNEGPKAVNDLKNECILLFRFIECTERMLVADPHPEGKPSKEDQKQLKAQMMKALERMEVAKPRLRQHLLETYKAQQRKAAAAAAAAVPVSDSQHTQQEMTMSDGVREAMDRLVVMGFSDVDKNLALLQKHSNNLEATLNDLLVDAALPPSDGSSAAPIPPSAASASDTASVEQQQLSSRLTDIAHEPLALLSPITGVGATPRQPIMAAAMASGVPDMDAHGFIASESGAAQANGDPYGLDADEAGALTLYTLESELYSRLNTLLRKRDRQLLKSFSPYLKLMLDARRKLPRFAGVVWRGVKGINLADRYPKGKEFFWWAFSSATKELSSLQNPMFLGTSGVRTVFNIQVKRGVDCFHLSGRRQRGRGAPIPRHQVSRG